MAEAVFSAIMETLASKASEEWMLMGGVKEEFKRTESNLMAIRSMLDEAEERQYSDRHLKLWLEKVKEISYDMEDLLDDWKTSFQELQTAGHGVETRTTVPKWKVSAFFSCFSVCSQVARRFDFAHRMKEMNVMLDELAKERSRFHLLERVSGMQPRRGESTWFVDKSTLHGRDGIRNEVIRTLLCETSEVIGIGGRIPTIITIVGMVGIGKTALAQLIYNDHRIDRHFNQKIWVCVSESDERHTARAILEHLLDSPNSLLDQTMEMLLFKIHENIKEKRLFLVLDDAWIDRNNYWETLKATFQSTMLGSRILVTTRKESVALNVKSSCVFHLDLLSDETCWLILSQMAFTERSRMSYENLEDIGREIAKKCKGLPFVAKAFGGFLRGKLRREWEIVLNSEIWKLDFAQEYIFSPLLLSYHDLPSVMKRCLLYCAIFPKDYEIDRDELVQHWMAQGYLGSDYNLETELSGEDYFRRLASSSFFHNFDQDANGNIICCKMHDIVHDFVQYLTMDGFVTEKIVEDLTLDLNSRKSRFLRLVIGNCSSFPLLIFGTEKLRSLVVVSDHAGFNKTTNEALQNLFSRSQRLRVLELDSLYLDPKEIALPRGKLIYLRYLSLKYCFRVEALLEAVCELPSLQSLNLEKCILDKLPVGIGKLINMRYLCTKDCFGLTYYPKGISNLTSLKRLSNVKMRADRNDADEFCVGDLKNLDLLGGNLCVELIGDAIDWAEAKRAELHRKTHLKRMEIWLCSRHLKKEEVVQALNPPSNLLVKIFDYQTWMTRKMQFAMEKTRVAVSE